MELKIYKVDKNYIDQLHNNVDSKVEFHHGAKQKPYLGIILKIQNFNYFVPFSSPKNKHAQMEENLSLIKLYDPDNQNNLLAVLNINNMIPIPPKCFSVMDFSKITDIRYKTLLEKEYEVCKIKRDTIKNNAKRLYSICTSNSTAYRGLKNMSVNFKNLEAFCINY